MADERPTGCRRLRGERAGAALEKRFLELLPALRWRRGDVSAMQQHREPFQVLLFLQTDGASCGVRAYRIRARGVQFPIAQFPQLRETRAIHGQQASASSCKR